MMSAIVQGTSHWFNRFDSSIYTHEMSSNGFIYVDLTGDQFGFAPVQISSNLLYNGAKIRDSEELNSKTRKRAELLNKRLGSNISLFWQ